MEKAKVYFSDLRTSPTSNLLDKMERLLKRAGIGQLPLQDSFTAIKIHFGEPGNLAYIRPNYAARMANLLRSFGAKPFLTDCNTLYSGRRSNAVEHLQSAMENGFNPISAQCQVIIADGVKGTDYREIPIDGEYCPTPKIGTAIADADIIISMNHFKGHEQTGFGGALKNLGMGCASVGGKLELHASSQPKIDTGNCIGCNICVKHCAHNAIHLNAERKAEIDYAKCVGCGQCVALCQHDAAVVSDWDTSERLNYKIAEYSAAVLKDKPHFHISFIMNVSPECDCWNHNDAAIIPDLGMLASADPVALDKACADLVIQSPILHGNNVLAKGHEHEDLCGCDKFHMVHPDTDWLAGLRHAEKIGLGTMDYELIKSKAAFTLMAKTMEEVLERFRTIEFHEDFDMIVAIANGGIVPAGIINQRLQKEVHLLRINLRDEYQHPKYDVPQLLAPVDFDFKGKNILLVDDRIKTGSTIRLARELLKDACSIKTFAVNGTADYALFDETCFKFPWIL